MRDGFDTVAYVYTIKTATQHVVGTADASDWKANEIQDSTGPTNIKLNDGTSYSDDSTNEVSMDQDLSAATL